MNPNHVIAVFGCGGDRDRTKRPIMGRIGAELADIPIVTSDNPRSENPDAIVAEVEEGVKQGLRRDSIMKSSSTVVKPFIAPSNWHKKMTSSSLPVRGMKRIRS